MLYQSRPVLQTGKDIGVKHIIADIVHGALACALTVLATMIVTIGLAVLPVLSIGQRPAAIRTLYQSRKNLCRTVFAFPSAACYLLLYLPENLLADNRLANGSKLCAQQTASLLSEKPEVFSIVS